MSPRNRIRADQRFGLLLGGVVLLTFLAIGATVALPASDASLDAEGQDPTAAEIEGMAIYRSEGLWYCHAAYVRQTAVDGRATGKSATTPEVVAGRSPVMLGLERMSSSVPDARTLARDCGVDHLSDAKLEAVQAFLDARVP